VSLGPAKAGPVRLMWDGASADGGMAEAGIYRIEFRATAADGSSSVSAKTLVSSEVLSVGREGDAVKVRLSDGRMVGSGDVVEWLK
jgi:flagellar hook assembly protein FlgD